MPGGVPPSIPGIGGRPGRGPRGLFGFSVPFSQPTRYQISGVTKDAQGVALANCVVDIFMTRNDMLCASATSDADGNYSVGVSGVAGLTFYAVAYKTGSPDVAGVTVNTLVAANA